MTKYHTQEPDVSTSEKLHAWMAESDLEKAEFCFEGLPEVVALASALSTVAGRIWAHVWKFAVDEIQDDRAATARRFFEEDVALLHQIIYDRQFVAEVDRFALEGEPFTAAIERFLDQEGGAG